MIIDLTMPIDGRTPNWPGDPEISLRQHSTVEKDGIAKKLLTLHSHVATHIDAPSHMVAGGRSLSDFPVDAFVGDAIAIDVRGQKVIQADLGEVRENDIVFFFTAHSDTACQPGYFKDSPAISQDTALELIRRSVKMVGLDAPSPDTDPFPVHKLLMSRNILIVENLVNLAALAGKRFRCVALPLKIDGGDGAPCRVIGIIE